MTSFLTRCCRLLAVAVIAGAVFGCISSNNPATRFYLLTPMDVDLSGGSLQTSEGHPSVEIGAVRLPQYLERPQIVTRSSENRLELAEFDQWAGNLRKNMARVLAMNLTGLLQNSHIAIVPYGPPGGSDFRLEMEVLQFERAADGRVRLTAHWRISKGTDRIPLVSRTTQLSAEAKTDDSAGSMETTVAAMSRLTGDLSRIIGREILEQQARSKAGS